MKIRSLAIRRMPGFENAGFDLNDLSEGLNLIIGPNASGKTTTCHAIRGLLWPDTLAGQTPVSLASEWADGQNAWRLELEGSRAACQRDGVPAERPPLPGAHLAKCFTITVDNLFEDTEIDKALASNVAREMAGGYDLGALRTDPWLKLPAKHGRKEHQELRDRTRAGEQIRAQQQDLLRQEQELTRLDEQANQSREAQWKLSLVQTAIELLELRGPIDAGRAALAALPPGMEKLQGNEGQALAQIQDDLDEQAGLLNDAQAAREDAARIRRETALPDDGIAPARIAQQQSDLEALREIQKDIRGLHSKLADADARVQAALKALGTTAAEDALDAIDAQALDAVEAFHGESQAHKARRAAVEGQLLALGEEQPARTSIETLIGGLHILQDWLDAAPGEPAPLARRLPRAAVATALALAAGGAVVAILVHPWWLLCLAPAALMAGAALWPTPATADSRRRDLCQDQYARTALPPLPAWD
ncbi:MAG: AAA family ATPase, partial [Planctomycetota bacterium]